MAFRLGSVFPKDLLSMLNVNDQDVNELFVQGQILPRSALVPACILRSLETLLPGAMKCQVLAQESVLQL